MEATVRLSNCGRVHGGGLAASNSPTAKSKLSCHFCHDVSLYVERRCTGVALPRRVVLCRTSFVLACHYVRVIFSCKSLRPGHMARHSVPVSMSNWHVGHMARHSVPVGMSNWHVGQMAMHPFVVSMPTGMWVLCHPKDWVAGHSVEDCVQVLSMLCRGAACIMTALSVYNFMWPQWYPAVPRLQFLPSCNIVRFY
jgi:hypothetical protein